MLELLYPNRSVPHTKSGREVVGHSLFVQLHPTSDFLGARDVPEVPAKQLLQLSDGSRLLAHKNSGDAQGLSRPQVAWNVIKENCLAAGHPESVQGELVDLQLWLPRPLHARFDHLNCNGQWLY